MPISTKWLNKFTWILAHFHTILFWAHLLTLRIYRIYNTKLCHLVKVNNPAFAVGISAWDAEQNLSGQNATSSQLQRCIEKWKNTLQATHCLLKYQQTSTLVGKLICSELSLAAFIYRFNNSSMAIGSTHSSETQWYALFPAFVLNSTSNSLFFNITFV